MFSLCCLAHHSRLITRRTKRNNDQKSKPKSCNCFICASFSRISLFLLSNMMHPCPSSNLPSLSILYVTKLTHNYCRLSNMLPHQSRNFTDTSIYKFVVFPPILFSLLYGNLGLFILLRAILECLLLPLFIKWFDFLFILLFGSTYLDFPIYFLPLQPLLLL